MTDTMTRDPELVLAVLLYGRRYDDAYPAKDLAFLDALACETGDDDSTES